MIFELNKKELKNLKKWQKTLPKNMINYTDYYIFTPTGIGNAITVKREYSDGKVFEKNITDYNSW